MILFCCASELGLPEDLSAIEVILYYYYVSAASIHVCISCTSYAPRQLSKASSHTLLGCGVPVCLSVSFEEHAQDVHHLHEL